MKISIRIQGNPIAKKRPRFFQKGNYKGAYNPQEGEESRWLWEVMQQLPAGIERPIFGKGVPVRMSCLFIFERPKSHYGTGKNSSTVKPSSPEHHVQKPDGDNLEKFVKDCLNGVVWHDDCQVVISKKAKGWDSVGFTEILIEKL